MRHGLRSAAPSAQALALPPLFLLSAIAGLGLFNAIHGLALRGARAAAGGGARSSTAGGSAGGGSAAATGAPADAAALQLLLQTRVCGSPAVDGYAHVNDSCLLASPTAKWYKAWVAAGGRPEELVVHLEAAADIDGIAVKWGIGNKFESPEECAHDCWAHRPGQIEGPFSALPCNSFSWCGEAVCFEPDAHNHTRGDCWLKWSEAPASPELNMRGELPPDFRARHPTAPQRTQWTAGVLLPPGVTYSNGSWSPRWSW